VTFDRTLSVRLYETVLSDNPCPMLGSGVSIGWEYVQERKLMPSDNDGLLLCHGDGDESSVTTDQYYEKGAEEEDKEKTAEENKEIEDEELNQTTTTTMIITAAPEAPAIAEVGGSEEEKTEEKEKDEEEEARANIAPSLISEGTRDNEAASTTTVTKEIRREIYSIQKDIENCSGVGGSTIPEDAWEKVFDKLEKHRLQTEEKEQQLQVPPDQQHQQQKVTKIESLYLTEKRRLERLKEFGVSDEEIRGQIEKNKIVQHHRHVTASRPMPPMGNLLDRTTGDSSSSLSSTETYHEEDDLKRNRPRRKGRRKKQNSSLSASSYSSADGSVKISTNKITFSGSAGTSKMRVVKKQQPNNNNSISGNNGNNGAGKKSFFKKMLQQAGMI
jgi:hypothetical protein